MNIKDNPEIPCFLCGKMLEVKQTKSNKPYFICDTCGLQTFVRYKAGIQLFQELLTSLTNMAMDKELKVVKKELKDNQAN